MAEGSAPTEALLGGGETVPVLGATGSILNLVRSRLASLRFWRRAADVLTVAACAIGFGISVQIAMSDSSASTSVCSPPKNPTLLHVALLVFPWLAMFFMTVLSESIRVCTVGGPSPSRLLTIVQLVVGVFVCMWVEMCAGGLVGVGFTVIAVFLFVCAMNFCFIRPDEMHV